MINSFAEFELGATLVQYLRDENGGSVGMRLLPAAMKDRIIEHRRDLHSLPEFIHGNSGPPAVKLESIVQLKTLGQPYPGGYAQGRTMRRAPEVWALNFVDQHVDRQDNRTIITTRLQSALGYSAEHELCWYKDQNAGEIRTTFKNESTNPVSLEMLSSFALDGITPFAIDDAPDRLYVHRLRSSWAAEGRLESNPIEDLHLEPSWANHSMNAIRFGQIGSMPVKQFFPWAAVEDRQAGVIWGAQLAWAGSWQMEIGRQDDWATISGGLADSEFGHWMKTIPPGATFTAPRAIVACVQGDVDDLAHALTQTHQRFVQQQPIIEEDLPILCNEWCTTWGNPSHENMMRLANRLQGTPVKFLTIDAGWYKKEGSDWQKEQGEWIPSKQLFPDGIEATASAIREHGLIPGLWFELEVVGEDSPLFSKSEWLLHRNGTPITVSNRRFWDMSNPRVIAYLTERVIGLLQRGKFGYLKIDYNETIGVGCDGWESPGEGLRRHIQAVESFFNLIRQRLPDLLIEMCASGGHRLEPSLLSIGAQGSFSDAHECPEIPIIAANLHRAMLPRQSQIWAVLRADDSKRRTIYSLAATFLGRMCLSGQIPQLSDEQWKLTQHAMDVYRQAAPVIRDGITRQYLHRGRSWRHPTGWQGIVRLSKDGQSALVVLHSFNQPPEQAVSVPLPNGDWKVVATLAENTPEVSDEKLAYNFPGAFSGCAVVLRR